MQSSSSTNFRLTIIVLIASTFTVMAGSAIAPALPGMLTSFQDSAYADFKIRMAISLSAGTTMLCSSFVGNISDRVGYISTLKAGLILIVASGLAGLFSASLEQLLISRCILGVGVAAVAISTTAWIGDQHSGAGQHKITGYLGVAMESSGLVYFGLAGALALIHWRGVFIIYLLPIIVIFLLPKQPKIELTHESTSDTSEKNYLNYSLIVVASFTALFGLNIYVTQLPFVFAAKDASSLIAGFALAGASLSAAAASFVFPKIMRYWHQHQVLVLAFVVSGSGFVALFLFSSIMLMSIAVFICGFGFGLTIPSLISWINVISNENNRGAGQAKLAMAGFSGQFVSPLALQPFVTNYGIKFGFLSFAGVSFLFAFVMYLYPLLNKKVSQDITL